jgi:hypothetical protein
MSKMRQRPTRASAVLAKASRWRFSPVWFVVYWRSQTKVSMLRM